MLVNPPPGETSRLPYIPTLSFSIIGKASFFLYYYPYSLTNYELNINLNSKNKLDLLFIENQVFFAKIQEVNADIDFALVTQLVGIGSQFESSLETSFPSLKIADDILNIIEILHTADFLLLFVWQIDLLTENSRHILVLRISNVTISRFTENSCHILVLRMSNVTISRFTESTFQPVFTRIRLILLERNIEFSSVITITR